MHIGYTINGEPFAFEAEEEDDLRALAAEVAERIQSQHPDFPPSGLLSVLIADGLLNSLAEDAEQVTLGELARR